MYKDIKVDVSEGIATVTLNRPDRLNAIRRETIDELEHAIRTIQSDDSIRVVIFTGAGDRAFSAGADLKGGMFSENTTAREAISIARRGQELMRLVEEFDKPTIAAVNGYAIGGGCEFALACDIVLASENAEFAQSEINLGIVPGWGGSQRLGRVTSRNRAKEFVLTGDRIKAEHAREMGLVNAVYPPEKLTDAARGLAMKLASKSPVALRLAKRLVDAAYDADLRTGLDLELQAFSLCFSTEDAREGIRAFVEKRQPKFKGR